MKFINGGYMKIKDLKEAIEDLDDDVRVTIDSPHDNDRKVSFSLDEEDDIIEFVITQGV